MRILTSLTLITLFFLLHFAPSKSSDIFIVPRAGPIDGLTMIRIYSTEFTGQNYSTYPTPSCRFSQDPDNIIAASWIHCVPLNTLLNMYQNGNFHDSSAARNETCLTCMTDSADSEGIVNLDVSLEGDFSDTATTLFTYYTEPTVSYTVPTLGKKTGGTYVQVFGSDFKDVGFDLHCAFGTVYSAATFVNENLITCLAPASDTTDAPIPLKVTQNVQQVTPTYTSWYYYEFPEISELIPNKGPNTGGTLVYLKGKMMYPFKISNVDITNTTFVKFGDNYVSNVTLINNTHISVTSPPSYLNAPLAVELTFNDQEWTNNGILFYYYNPPYVFQLVPDSGTIQGGTNVTVIGANFYPTDTLTCKFGNSTVPGNYIDTNHVWCITPEADQAGYVFFGLALETDQFSGNNIQYLYTEPAIIDLITPLCGPTSGFTQLTVIGQNFIATGPNMAFCIFGSQIYQIATIINTTLLYCDSPSVLDKFGNNYNNTQNFTFQLTLNGVDNTSYPDPFIYYTTPSISSISPNSGPVTAGTNITLFGSDFSMNCIITARFGTIETPCNYTNSTQVQCAVPPTTCPDDTVVQLALNGQQFTPNDYTNQNTIYSYYRGPTVSYIDPVLAPNTGGNTVTIYGRGFLYSRNDSTGYNGQENIMYYCLFQDDSGDTIGVTSSIFVDDTSIECPTPAVASAQGGVTVYISTNQQNWYQVPPSISYYMAPQITSVSPAFGPIKQKGTYLTVSGSNFKCLDAQCSTLACAFVTSSFRIITQGTLLNSNTIQCQIPPVSRPDVTNVQITLNGNDFTSQNVQYTFFDAFILSFAPSVVPVEGNTLVQIEGYGFANTPDLTVQFGDNVNTVITCYGNTPCVLSATYVNENLLTFTAPPLSQLTYANGSAVGFDAFEVEVSVYGGVYTDNGLTLQYYLEPTVSNFYTGISPNSSLLTFHANTSTTVFASIQITVPPGITYQGFLKKLQPACQYIIGGQTFIVQGKLLNYPFSNSNPETNNLTLVCQTPETGASGNGFVSVSINGENFVGTQSTVILPQLGIATMAPTCGPVYGGTPVYIQTQGVQNSDTSNMFFMWGTTCTPAISTSATSISDNFYFVNSPPIPNQDSLGGASFVVLSNGYDIDYSSGINGNGILDHIYARSEFLYYTQPIIQSVAPHSALYTGGTPVIIQGAFFFTDTAHSCTPKCRFGDIVVEANYLSTVQIQCVTPNYGSVSSGVSLEVSMNGVDFTTSGTLFNFVQMPVITDINPKNGPSSGGTVVTLSGSNFINLSQYPNEFMCVWQSINLNIPTKTTPAVFINSNTIYCTSPGGWGAGNIASVDLTYNGFDMTNSTSTFRFYQVDSFVPLSGPASGDGNTITIYGSGFVQSPGIACKIGGVISNATSVNWTAIQCPIPASPNGPKYFGKSDFFYTLDGTLYQIVIQGFSYYQQPIVSGVFPDVLPVAGGIIQVTGQYFRSDFYGALLTCKIADTVVPAQLVSDTEIICDFGRLNYVYTVSSPIQNIAVALNSLSYTQPVDNSTVISIFDVSSISPDSGITEGGTLISVKGFGFIPGATAECRFGIPGTSLTTYGTVITSESMTCQSPPPTLPVMGDIPFTLPFSVTFSDPQYEGYTASGTFFRYYTQPVIVDMQPKAGLVDHNVLITVTSDPSKNFGQALVGGPNGIDGPLVAEDLSCDFGIFGTSSGIFINQTTIQCLTPNTKVALEEISEEPVTFTVAINGQDYISTELQYSFQGTKPLNNYGIVWVFAILIGSSVLIAMLYFMSKLFTNPENQFEPRARVSYEPRGSGLPIGGQYPGQHQGPPESSINIHQGMSSFNVQQGEPFRRNL